MTILTEFTQRYRGVMVVGDIHGAISEFRNAVSTARNDGYAIFSLGDIVNRGPATLDCIRLALELISEGMFDMIPGNHEQRLAMVLDGEDLTEKDKDKLTPTIRELDADPQGWEDARRLIDWLKGRPCWHIHGPWIFVHGAIDRGMIDIPAPRFGEVDRRSVLNIAIDGQRIRPEGELIYDWLDEIPGEYTVFIGHDPCAMTIGSRTGALGARCVHLDSGCGRESGPTGPLLWRVFTSEEIFAN